MKWLIVGTSKISEDFIKALNNNGEKAYGILSRTEDRGSEFAKQNNVPNAYTNLDEAIKLVDCVYVATPNSTHYEIAKQVILKKKHVMIEKPMTHSLQTTIELFKLAKKNKVKIMEAYTHITNLAPKETYNGDIITNYMQKSSKIKNNVYKTASSFNPKLFGGVIADLGVYPISLCIMLLGNVKFIDIWNVKKMNGVEVSADIELGHKRGTSTFSISKLEDGNNKVFLNGVEIIEHVSLITKKNRMDKEVSIFVNEKSLKFWKAISIETARVVEELRKKGL